MADTMTEDLAKQWERFSLMEVETLEVDAPEPVVEALVERGSTCVVGKLLADRVVGKEILKTPLIRAWQPTGWVNFKNIGSNLFLIEFENEWDKSRIMEGRPWTFDGDLVSLAEFDGITPPSQLEFEKAAFWVRMFELPLACMSKEMGQRIGASVGTVEEVEVDDEGVGWGEYLRVRIILDLSKPLSRVRFIKLRDKSIWIPFRYEKIPRFCFKCGTIRHGDRGCVRPGGRRSQEKENEVQFGPWLRVTPPGNRGGRGGGGRGRYGGFRGGSFPGKNFVNTGFSNMSSPAHGENEGSEAEEQGEDSSEEPDGPSRSANGNLGPSNDTILSKTGSGIPGWQKRKKTEEVNRGNNEAEITEGESQGNQPAAEMLHNDKRGENQPNRGKSIYVGQWDTIKEKMVWQAMEKDPARVGFTGHVETNEHVEQFLTPNQLNRGEGQSTRRARSKICAKKTNGTSDTCPQIGGRNSSQGAEYFVGKRGEGELVGKRKNYGRSAETDRERGKRNKHGFELQDEGTDEEAVAEIQPRRLQ
jgi:hypothetical protein